MRNQLFWRPLHKRKVDIDMATTIRAFKLNQDRAKAMLSEERSRRPLPLLSSPSYFFKQIITIRRKLLRIQNEVSKKGILPLRDVISSFFL